MSSGDPDEVPGPIECTVARLLLGPSLVFAAALIVKGFSEVGDGFAAGVVMALAITLSYVTLGTTGAETALPVLRHAPALMIAGLFLALASGFFPVVLGEPPLSHRPGPGADVERLGTLELFTPLAFDVGVFLLVVGALTVLIHQMAHPDEPPPDAEEEAGKEPAADAERPP